MRCINGVNLDYIEAKTCKKCKFKAMCVFFEDVTKCCHINNPGTTWCQFWEKGCEGCKDWY